MESQEISYVIIGTAQPALEDVKKKDLNNYLPLWKQEVRDEKGRKRLHGAFKGGFSAGYFNTVGSKEGWTPTQFVSSRTNRQKVSYKPEDFMDEEDLEDFNETKRLAATANYDVKAGQEELMARKQAILNSEENKNSIFGGLTEKILDDIIIPNTEPIGIKLLKSMGWREGQGIGARVHRKNTDDIYAEKYLFAPKDVKMVSFDQKTNLFGLGFDPYKNAPEFRDNYYTHSKNQNQTKHDEKKTLGFGVGIFEEEDDDVYNNNSMENFNDTIDDTMDDYEEKIVLGNTQLGYKSNKIYEDYERDAINNENKEKLQMCSDGTYPISGFLISSTIEKIGKWFNPPVVPKTFIPYHKFKHDDKNQTENLDKDTINNTRTSLTADQRRDILGEEKLKGPSKTFMNSLSNSDQYKLQNLIDDITRKREDESKNLKVEIPELKKDVALAALKGFMPFQAMPSKQERYKRFLEVKAGIEKDYLEFPDIYTNKEKNLEYKEFAKAAQIYQPLSNAMASRFTSASNEKGSDKNSEKNKKDEVVVIERTVVDWQPSRLLCKRFNIANPHKDGIDSTADNKSQVDDILNEDTINKLIQERDRDYGSKKIESIIEKGEERKRNEEQNEKENNQNKSVDNTSKLYAEDEPSNVEEKNELLSKERPSMDLFNSIFNDSDEDDDEESDEEEDDKKKLKLPSNTEIITSATSINKSSNQINDLSSSNSKIIKTDDNKNENDSENKTSIAESEKNSKIKDLNEAFQIIKTMKEKKNKKHGSKHSKHHHDSKRRKKKRKHHYSSDSSSSEDNSSDEDSKSKSSNHKHRHSSKRKRSNSSSKKRHHHHKKSKSHKASDSSSSSDSGSDTEESSDVEWVEKSIPDSSIAESRSETPSSVSSPPQAKRTKRNRPTAMEFM